MHVPPSGGPLRLPPQFLAPSLSLPFLRGGVIPARGGVGGCCQGWGPNPRASLLLGISARRAPCGNRTWNLDCGARSVQGPLSAAARIDTARPWGQISLPKSPWPPRRRRRRERGRGGTGRPPASFAWVALLWGELSLPIRGELPPPWAHPGPRVTGNRRWRAGRAAGFDHTSAAPALPPPGVGADLGLLENP